MDPVSDFGIDDDVSGVVLPLDGAVIGGVDGGGVDEVEGAIDEGGVLGGSDGVGVLLHATSVAQAATSNACETFMRILINVGIGPIAEAPSLRIRGGITHRTRAQRAVGRVLTACAAFATRREKSRQRDVATRLANRPTP
ncbi:MAG: hypothetical protein ABI881_02155 [Betaproteobacteria bacterium]